MTPYPYNQWLSTDKFDPRRMPGLGTDDYQYANVIPFSGRTQHSPCIAQYRSESFIQVTGSVHALSKGWREYEFDGYVDDTDDFIEHHAYIMFIQPAPQQ